jgi:hypothetical protein
MILNNEYNIFIDIGLNNIKLNMADASGVVKIPPGLSVVDVHESLFDPTLGGTVDIEANKNMLYNESLIYGDPLFPYNFAYKLAGLPMYHNGLVQQGEVNGVDVFGSTVIQLDGAFLPYSVSVNSSSHSYIFHMGNIPITPGTFTIEPNSGIIRVAARLNTSGIPEDTVNVSYTKSSYSIRPCGMLFNRVASYIDYKSLYNMLSILGVTDSTFYTFLRNYNVNGTVEDFILVPKVDTTLSQMHQPYHNRLMYSTSTDSMYCAAKFKLSTNNANLSPAIHRVFINGIK